MKVIFATKSGPLVGSTRPFVQKVTGYLRPGFKRPVRATEHTRPNVAEVRSV